MPDLDTLPMLEPVRVIAASGTAPFVVVCEHASAHVPEVFDNLGLDAGKLASHAAWDPGAQAVAVALARGLDAPLVHGTISRLVYDCNRPPDAPDAIVSQSEHFAIPGNTGLTQAARRARASAVHDPFHAAVSATMAGVANPVLVTMHSFTPVYFGKTRQVEIGLLHDSDTRLADAMLDLAAKHTPRRVARNDPYGPEDGVTHTLKRHALGPGHLNVMIELRNDLIATPQAQAEMARMLVGWITTATAAARGAG